MAKPAEADQQHGPPIGSKLRAARQQRGMTISQLAAETNLSSGFISLLERDETSASVGTLFRICGALGIRIGSLFEENRTNLVRGQERPSANFGGYGVEDELLTPGWERSLQVIESRIEPGGRSGDEPHSFEADAELIYVLRGRLNVAMQEEVHRLRTGDALLIVPREPHAWWNPSASRPATVLWIITPTSL
ncbi:MAG: helix-turn-helix domain-containing protein [Actinomycetota bacterium]